MLKKIVIFMISIQLVCMLVSCSGNKYKSNDSEKVSFSSELDTKIDEKLYVKAKVVVPKKNQYTIYKGKLRTYSPDEIIKSCFETSSNPEIVNIDKDEYLIKSDGKVANFSCYLKYFSENFYKKQMTLINRLGTSFQPEHITYSYPMQFPGLSMRDELKNLSKKDAIMNSKKYLESLGLNVGETPYCIFAFDQSTIEEMQTLVKKDVGADLLESLGEESVLGEVREEDEFYYMLWNVLLDNETFLEGNYNRGEVDGVNDITMGTTIFVAVNAEGFLATDVSRIYEVISDASEYNKLLSMDSILATLKNKYRNTILTTDIIFSNVTFCYAPRIVDMEKMEIEIVPAWTFFAEYVNNEQQTEATVTSINAITGEVIN